MKTQWRVRYHRQILDELGRVRFPSGAIITDLESVPSVQRDKLQVEEVPDEVPEAPEPETVPSRTSKESAWRSST